MRRAREARSTARYIARSTPTPRIIWASRTPSKLLLNRWIRKAHRVNNADTARVGSSGRKSRNRAAPAVKGFRAANRSRI